MKKVIDGIEAFLFDMDGTLVTSIEAVEKVWTAWANRVGISPQKVLAIIHGRPARSTIAELAPNLDLAIEEAWVLDKELNESKGVMAITGVHEFIDKLDGFPWAIVTSADTDLALHRLSLARIPIPKTLITINHVKVGKPHPECFELAARGLGVLPQNCLVVEDTNTGLKAGKAAGMKLLGITTTYPAEVLMSDYAFKDYQDLEFFRSKKMLHVK
jgi:sugar-phosphatase